MPTFPHPDPAAPTGADDDEPTRRDAASLEEYLVEYLCREQITADEIKELMVSEAISNCNY